VIEHLQGRLAQKGPTAVHLQVGPVRLEIAVPISTSSRLPQENETTQLWIHLHWRADEAPLLFGFATRTERELFRLLIQVQGIGPRIALSVLSHLSPPDLVREIRQRSVEGLRRVPGIGPKTAGRMLVELGPRMDRLSLTAEDGAPTDVRPGEEDAIQALTALGYPGKESRKAVESILQEMPALPLDECIRRALRLLADSKS